MVFAFAFAMAQTDTTDPGVVINGVKWATRNVGAPGTFVEKPEDAGMFYQWNSKTGWSPSDDFTFLVSTNGSSWNSDWNGNGATTWETANNVCPTGWRVPTRAEFTRLVEAGNKWTTTPANGQIFGSGANTIFLPAAGYGSAGDEINSVGTNGRYWTGMVSGNRAYSLIFYSSSAYPANLGFPNSGFSVRCVAE